MADKRLATRTEEELARLREVQKLFGQQVEPLRKPLLRFAIRRCFGDVDKAEDLVQMTLFRCYSHFERFEQGRNLKAWLFACLVNESLNQSKTKASKVFASAVRLDRPNDDGEAYLLNSKILATNGDFYDSYLSDELGAAIRALPLIFRAPFVLGCVEEIPHKEICEILNLPMGTVRSRIHRARNRLTQSLASFAEREGYAIPTRGLGRRRHEHNENASYLKYDKQN